LLGFEILGILSSNNILSSDGKFDHTFRGREKVVEDVIENATGQEGVYIANVEAINRFQLDVFSSWAEA
jgi:hypothetical protein